MRNLCQLEIDGVVDFHHLFEVQHFPSTVVAPIHDLRIMHKLHLDPAFSGAPIQLVREMRHPKGTQQHNQSH